MLRTIVPSARRLLLLLAGVAPLLVRSDQNESIIEWVRSRGGLFSDKMEIRRMVPNDPNSSFGVFAISDIKAKERLLEVPKSCFIALSGDEVATDYSDDDEDGEVEHMNRYWQNVCNLSKKLLREMKLGADSDFAPYIAYLKNQKPGQLPATWSAAGKNLLRNVLGKGPSLHNGNNVLPPEDCVDWIDVRFKQTGCIDADDPFQEHVVALTIQRGYDTALIPIWDMFNHDNSLLNTENDSMHEEFGLKVRAAEDIDAGEEIFATYNECVDCGDLTDYWGTPEILRDFGFVERYPQNWVFWDDDMYIWFTVEPSADDSGEEPTAYFMEHGTPEEEGRPDKDGIRFLREQLERLEKVATNDLKERGAVPESEWNVILQFHQAATVAISAALKAASKNIDEL